MRKPLNTKRTVKFQRALTSLPAYVRYTTIKSVVEKSVAVESARQLLSLLSAPALASLWKLIEHHKPITAGSPNQIMNRIRWTLRAERLRENGGFG